MQKHHAIFLFLLVATTTFAQKAVQHAAYVGVQYPYLTVNYDARFRNPDHKVDFAVGAGLSTSTPNSNLGVPVTSVGAHGSFLFGKGASAFELGMNSFYDNYSYTGRLYSNSYNYIYNNSIFRINNENIAFRPFIGYRLQPKNKHFILQIQHSPYIFGTQTIKYLDFNNTVINQFAGSPYQETNYGQPNTYVNWAAFFALHLGCNINTIKEKASENTAYQAAEKEKITLEHSVAASFMQGYEYANIGLAYDLRLRRPEGVDFALSVGYGLGYSSSLTQQYEASALFFKGKANLEAGIGVHRFYSFYISPNAPKVPATAIGIPLGFRYQAHRHVFIRTYVMPYKAFYDEDSTRENTKSFGFIDGTNWVLNVGYTF
jgi:hypothetical protein